MTNKRRGLASRFFTNRGTNRNILRDKSNSGKARTARRRKRAMRSSEPEDLDVSGLGTRLCQVLGVRSGDTVEFHVLADGSVRIVNYRDR